MNDDLCFYNTLTRRVEPFEPLVPGTARLYTCGPTVYNYAHIGNLRTFLFEDVLRRALRLFGFDVTQVMNLTDVDDKTIKGAREAGQDLRTYTDRFIAAFHEDMATLRAQPAEHYPRATDYIPQMVGLVRRLEAAGHTYRSEGSVYFRIASFPAYGALSGASLAGNLVGARVDADEYEKEDARDFVLWKAAKEGEQSWDTELGPGRPGWHLECSCMALDLLGESFDIHAGGVDLVFPHHENEIAQSEGATGHRFARYWLHAEHLVVEGEKMAKSKGNFFTLRDLLERGHDPLAIRYLLISVPYRQKLNFTFDGLHAAGAAVERIANTLRRLEHAPAASGAGDLDPAAVTAFEAELRSALADDLNTARALGALHTLLRQVNTALDGNGIGAGRPSGSRPSVRHHRRGARHRPPQGDRGRRRLGEIQRLVDERTAARKARDFARADAVRDELAARGILLEDTPHGTVWQEGEKVRK